MRLDDVSSSGSSSSSHGGVVTAPLRTTVDQLPACWPPRPSRHRFSAVPGPCAAQRPAAWTTPPRRINSKAKGASATTPSHATSRTTSSANNLILANNENSHTLIIDIARNLADLSLCETIRQPTTTSYISRFCPYNFRPWTNNYRYLLSYCITSTSTNFIDRLEHSITAQIKRGFALHRLHPQNLALYMPRSILTL